MARVHGGVTMCCARVAKDRRYFVLSNSILSRRLGSRPHALPGSAHVILKPRKNPRRGTNGVVHSPRLTIPHTALWSSPYSRPPASSDLPALEGGLISQFTHSRGTGGVRLP